MYLSLTNEWITGELTKKQHRKFATLSVEPGEYKNTRVKSDNRQFEFFMMTALLSLISLVICGSIGSFLAIPSLVLCIASIIRFATVADRVYGDTVRGVQSAMLRSNELRYLRRSIDSSRFIDPTKHVAFRALAETDGLQPNPTGVREYLNRYAAYTDDINAYLNDPRVQEVIRLIDDAPDPQHWTHETEQAFFGLSVQLDEYAQNCMADIKQKKSAASSAATRILLEKNAAEAIAKTDQQAIEAGIQEAWLVTAKVSNDFHSLTAKQLSA